MEASVLVIDDDRVIRMVVRDALEGAGLGVLEADDGTSGIETAAAHAPDLVILDIMLPRVDGLSVLGPLKAALPEETPIIVFSATGSRNANRALDLGASAYLDKPFDLAKLVALVRELLDGTARRAA